MAKTLQYLYDPLCGWCYGATPSISALLEMPSVTLELLPTGLFAAAGARPMDDDFAAYAWSNDQRIERLTGQRFTEPYRQKVLRDHRQSFDSGPARVALTAVALTSPDNELTALKAIQHARYVDGSDVTLPAMLAGLLRGLGLEAAATMVTHPGPALLAANRARIGRAQALMREFGARGVPTLIALSGAKRWLLDPAAAYVNPRVLISQLEAG